MERLRRMIMVNALYENSTLKPAEIILSLWGMGMRRMILVMNLAKKGTFEACMEMSL
jgi:hypothetical protein